MDDIAKILDVNKATANSRIYRALEDLRANSELRAVFEELF